MSEKRRGLGRGLGALIPSGTPTTRSAGERPVDVFFPGKEGQEGGVATLTPEDPASVPASGSPAVPSTGDGLPVVGNGQAPVLPEAKAARRTTEVSTAAAGAGRASAGVGRRPGVPSAPSGATAGAPPAGAELIPVPGARFAEIPVASISPNPRQPRQVFDEEELAELAHSVREVGVLQPVVVRAAAEQDGETRYELIMGERRWRACQEAGIERIPAIIRETSDDAMLRDALLENLHRSQLNPLEEAAAYQQLLEDFGCTHDDLAGRIGRSRPQISNTIRLLKLPPLVQRRVAAGVLSAGHARALLGLEDPAAMERLAQRIVAEGISVRATEEIVALGDESPAARRAKRPRPGNHRGELDELAARLGDHLDTKVVISLGRNKGRVSVEFASVEDLNRILAIITPGEPGAFRRG
ncbi:MAG: ParB/RepB/Spo0J family partition protein [Actinomycetales bacterium]|nr:ParB/RepB/Spo0J family partition protein [Actinomycetales bacterium]